MLVVLRELESNGALQSNSSSVSTTTTRVGGHPAGKSIARQDGSGCNPELPIPSIPDLLGHTADRVRYGAIGAFEACNIAPVRVGDNRIARRGRQKAAKNNN